MQTSRLVLLTCLCLCLSSFCERSFAQSDLAEKMEGLGNQNRYAEILEVVQKLPKQNRDATVRYFRFWALMGLDRKDEAKAEFEAASKVAVKTAYDHLILAKWHRWSGDPAKMYEQMELAIQADASLTEVKLFELRELRKYVDESRDPAANNHLGFKALSFREGNPTVEREWIMSISGWPTVRRIKELQAFCEKHPQDGVAHKYLGHLFVHQNNGAEALPPLEKAVRLLPKQGNVLVVRANAHTLMGNFEKALADHNRAIEIEPSAINIQARGLFWAYREKPDLAVADFVRAVKLDPKEPRLRQSSLEALLAAKKYEVAVKYLDQIATGHPSLRVEALFDKSGVYERQQKYDPSIVTINEAIKLAQSDNAKRQCLVRRAYLHSKFDKHDLAMKEIDALKTAYPDDPGVQRTAAFIHQRSVAAEAEGKDEGDSER